MSIVLHKRFCTIDCLSLFMPVRFSHQPLDPVTVNSGRYIFFSGNKQHVRYAPTARKPLKTERSEDNSEKFAFEAATGIKKL